MVNEVKKKVSGSIEGLAGKTQRLSIRLLSFVISGWLIIGTVVIGFAVPAYVGKVLFKTRYAQASVASESTVNAGTKLVIQPKDRYALRSYRYSGPSGFRKGLRETRDTVNEFRQLIRGFTSFASR